MRLACLQRGAFVSFPKSIVKGANPRERVRIYPTIALTVTVLLVCGIPAYGLETPQEAVKGMVDEVVGILKNDELKGAARTEERRSLLEVAVGRRLDYAEMAKRTLALHWRERTPAEQKEFVELFHRFLSKTYAHRLERYSQEEVRYEKVRVKDSYSEVQTIVASAKTEISMDYRLMLKDSRWWIYDIVVDGVSLVKNYRDQFERIIRSSSYAELVVKLRERSEEIANP